MTMDKAKEGENVTKHMEQALSPSLHPIHDPLAPGQRATPGQLQQVMSEFETIVAAAILTDMDAFHAGCASSACPNQSYRTYREVPLHQNLLVRTRRLSCSPPLRQSPRSNPTARGHCSKRGFGGTLQ
jgi:hypothetical protein